MPQKKVRLKGDLQGLDVTVDATGKVIRVTKDGKTVICKQTKLGLFCDPFNPGGSGGGAGPVLSLETALPEPDRPLLQLRLTKKRLFARLVDEGASDAEIKARKGFQRHDT